MATIKQKKAVEIMAENGWIASKAMLEAGYSPKSANKPSKLTQSKGYKEILDELWLTENLIVNALVEDITKKKQNRKPELELWARMRWMLVDRQEITWAEWKDLFPTVVEVIQPNESTIQADTSATWSMELPEWWSN